MNLGPDGLATQATFTRAEVLELLAYTRPRLTTVTLIAYQPHNMTSVYLQRNRKTDGYLFPGGGQRGFETHGDAIIREAAIEEHPVLSQHIRLEEIELFTVCTVLRRPESSKWQPLSKFCEGHGAPDSVMQLFKEVQVPLCIGTDIIMSCPVHGEVDLKAGVSMEAIEMACIDLALDRVDFGYYHRELADDWRAFVESGCKRRPSPTRVY
ncbi:MAG: hypothetical protein U0136_04755 [Bdellovibrionota bacterium]